MSDFVSLNKCFNNTFIVQKSIPRSALFNTHTSICPRQKDDPLATLVEYTPYVNVPEIKVWIRIYQIPSDLDEEQRAYVVEAMVEKVVQPGEVIIRWGRPTHTLKSTRYAEIKLCSSVPKLSPTNLYQLYLHDGHDQAPYVRLKCCQEMSLKIHFLS